MGQKHQDGENLQYSSIFFPKDKAGAGWEKKVSKFGQVLSFQNGHLIWIIEEKILKNIFVDFFDGFFKICFHYIEKQANLDIENLPLYDTYDFCCCILWKKDWSELFKTPQI